MALIGDPGRAKLGFRKYRRTDGSVFDVSVSGSLLRLDGPAVLCLVVQDMTEQKKAEQALRSSEARFRSTVDRLAEGVYIIDVVTKAFVEANAAILSMLGYTLDEFVALTQFDIVAGETPEEFARNVEQIRAALAKEGRCDLGRRRFRRKNGSVFPVELRVTVVPNDGAGLHAVIVRDVTDQVEYENRLFEYQSQLEDTNAKLKALAITDGLTGLRNRAAFDGKLAEEYDRATRYGHPLSIILLDVDHFKLFNDTFGHPAGDEVLKSTARLVRDTVRTADFVARYGGEEFVVILPDTDETGALVLAERCRRAMAGYSWDKRTVTISVGVATLTPTLANAAGLVQAADQALYRSKQGGRNRVSHSNGSIAR
jgi:diguanylate cyclase (GGDEF)-like protein/PAS domain S-box-containing protein